MTEADEKRKIIQNMKDNGGYGRRIEDSYGVGIFDTILVPKGLPVFFAEIKMVRNTTFGPTPRQFVELQRIEKLVSECAIPVMIGIKGDTYYFHPPSPKIDIRDCFSVTTSTMQFYDQLVKYYHSRRK